MADISSAITIYARQVETENIRPYFPVCLYFSQIRLKIFPHFIFHALEDITSSNSFVKCCKLSETGSKVIKVSYLRFFFRKQKKRNSSTRSNFNLDTAFFLYFLCYFLEEEGGEMMACPLSYIARKA